MHMSKIFIACVIVATLIPIVWYSYSYESQTPEISPSIPTPSSEKIMIPEVDPSDPKAGQCAICAQIGDVEPKAECMANFGCE